MRNHHLFEIINRNGKFKYFKMRNLFLLFIELVFSHGINQRIDPNCPWVHQRPRFIFSANLVACPPKDNILNLFYSDYDLNGVCHETCIEEALECIMSCDSTDSTCISACLRAEDTCVTSKTSDIKIIIQALDEPLWYKKNYIFKILFRLPLWHRLSKWLRWLC